MSSDPDYQLMIDLHFSTSNKIFYSEKFLSENWGWGIIIEIDLSQNISVYLVERGYKSKRFDKFRPEFASVAFKI